MIFLLLLQLAAADGPASFKARVTAFDARARELTDARGVETIVPLSIKVATAVSISPQSLPAGAEENAYSQALTASGGVPPYTWSVVDPTALPPGITLIGSSGPTVTLGGMPTLEGSYAFTVLVSDTDGRTVDVDYTIVIEDTVRIVVVADFDTPGLDELYVFRLSGTTRGAVQKLSDPAKGAVSTNQVSVSPDGTRVAYCTEAPSSAVYAVHISGAVPGPVQDVSHPFATASSGTAFDPLWSPDSRWLAYRADADVDGIFEIFVADLSMPAPFPVGKVHPAGNVNSAGGVQWCAQQKGRMAPLEQVDLKWLRGNNKHKPTRRPAFATFAACVVARAAAARGKSSTSR